MSISVWTTSSPRVAVPRKWPCVIAGSRGGPGTLGVTGEVAGGAGTGVGETGGGVMGDTAADGRAGAGSGPPPLQPTFAAADMSARIAIRVASMRVELLS